MEKMSYVYQKLSELPDLNLQGFRNYRFEAERNYAFALLTSFRYA